MIAKDATSYVNVIEVKIMRNFLLQNQPRSTCSIQKVGNLREIRMEGGFWVIEMTNVLVIFTFRRTWKEKTRREDERTGAKLLSINLFLSPTSADQTCNNPTAKNPNAPSHRYKFKHFINFTSTPLSHSLKKHYVTFQDHVIIIVES